MKAKEYRERYHKAIEEASRLPQHEDADQDPGVAYVKKELCAIISDFIREIGVMAQQRGVRSNSGLASILKELDQKWHAAFDNEPTICSDAFKKVLHREIPDTKLIWP